MADSEITSREQELARDLNRKVQRELMTKRWRYAALGLLLAAAAVATCCLDQWMLGFILLLATLICLLQYFDASGSLHEVQSRSTRRLTPDLSAFRPVDGTASSQKPSSA